jgi:hypothetical protein
MKSVSTNSANSAESNPRLGPSIFKAVWILCSIALTSTSVGAQTAAESGVWTSTGRTQDLAKKVGPRKYAAHSLSVARLREAMRRAPVESLNSPRTSDVVVPVPMPDGSLERVAIQESSIFSPELQALYSDMHTYRAVGVDHPQIQGRLDFTPLGFHAMLFTPEGDVFVDPAQRGDDSNYISYWKADLSGAPFPSDVVNGAAPLAQLAPLALFPANNPSGTQLRSYRLAVSVTKEYTNFFGGTAQAAAQITTTVNRVTGIYERDVAIRLNLVATRIFTNADPGPFTQATCDLRGQNQTALDANPGSANYDIGHVFSAGGGGGVATLGSVCVAASKAQGCTAVGNPSGDGFDVDYVAHEIGHQFGGNHTWSGNTCDPGGQFASGAAYEPGSGTTIMGYAGVCSAQQNVQPHSDPFFHTRSYDEIVAFRTTGAGNTCGTNSTTSNNPPTVDAGPGCTVPQSTPFTLTAQGGDPDGDALTFDWEQFDNAGAVITGTPSATATSGPNFRSYPASSSPSRTFPRFSDILSSAATPFEVLPAVNRTMNFRVTARDNRANGGGTDWDSTQVIVSGAPFSVAAPAQGAQLECGDKSTIMWNVGGGSVAPTLDIQLSTNGGASFSTIAAATANDGSEQVTLPRTLTSSGRVMLKPINACFFAVSKNFSIADTKPPVLTAPTNIVAECKSPTGTAVSLGTPTVSDLCDSNPTVTNNAPALFPLGLSTVTWTAKDGSANKSTATQSVKIQDTTAPVVSCNAPATIIPADAPISFTATAKDVCDAAPQASISSYDCYTFNGAGKRIDKKESCVVQFQGAKLTIVDSGGVGDIIEWTVGSTDASGNKTTQTCVINVAKP